MTTLESFVSGFLVGVVGTLVLGAIARKRTAAPPLTQAAPPAAAEQLGSATINAPDALAKIGHDTGAEIIDD